MAFENDPWMQKWEAQLIPSERELLSALDSPAAIQDFLNTVPYSEDKFYRCPLRLLRERKGHCFDGALFAAMALRRLGHPPLLLELVPNERDDDHILALFRRFGCWGALAQSNFSGLRYREPVYRSLRELAMSYFEDHFNAAGEKTLRGYRGPVRLRTFDRLDWMASDAGLERLADGMDRYRVSPLITDAMAAGLALMDERSLRAGLLGANQAGLFKVPDGESG
ncbi:MAG: hypothetical protein WCE68_11070 [Anaerolineales bacterium]